VSYENELHLKLGSVWVWDCAEYGQHHCFLTNLGPVSMLVIGLAIIAKFLDCTKSGSPNDSIARLPYYLCHTGTQYHMI